MSNFRDELVAIMDESYKRDTKAKERRKKEAQQFLLRIMDACREAAASKMKYLAIDRAAMPSALTYTNEIADILTHEHGLTVFVVERWPEDNTWLVIEWQRRFEDK